MKNRVYLPSQMPSVPQREVDAAQTAFAVVESLLTYLKPGITVDAVRAKLEQMKHA